MTVRALLAGDEFDLQILADLFPDGDPRVVQDEGDGSWYLETSELDTVFAEHGRMRDLADSVLGRLIGIARLADSSFRTAAVVGHFQRMNAHRGTEVSVRFDDTIGFRDRVTVARAGTAEIRVNVRATATATNLDGEVVRPTPRGPRYLDLAAANPAVNELLMLLSTSDMSWEDLYKAYEIVRASSRGGTKPPRWSLEQLGYAKREVDNFTVTVNLHRHARPNSQPQQELSLAECQQFVRDMAERWFRQLESGDE